MYCRGRPIGEIERGVKVVIVKFLVKCYGSGNNYCMVCMFVELIAVVGEVSEAPRTSPRGMLVNSEGLCDAPWEHHIRRR